MDVLTQGLLSHFDLCSTREGRCRTGREGLSLCKRFCWYPLPRTMNFWDYSRPRLTAQLSSQKRGEVLFLLMIFGSQAGGSLSLLYCLPGLDLAPAQQSYVSNEHLSNRNIVGRGPASSHWCLGGEMGDVPTGLGLVARPGSWQVYGQHANG